MQTLLFLGGGLFLIPALLVIGSIIFFVQAIKASKSGSKQQQPGKGTTYSDENVPAYKVPIFWFGAALAVAAVVTFIMMRADR